MCIGDALRGKGKNVLDKIRFSINKYCPCQATAFSKKTIEINRLSFCHHVNNKFSHLHSDEKMTTLRYKVSRLRNNKKTAARCQELGHLKSQESLHRVSAIKSSPYSSSPSSGPRLAVFITQNKSHSNEQRAYASRHRVSAIESECIEPIFIVFFLGPPSRDVHSVIEHASFRYQYQLQVRRRAANRYSSTNGRMDSQHDSCLTYTVKSLYNVSRGSNPVQDAFDQQLFLNKQCACNPLKSQLPSYGLLVVDKQSRLSSGLLQLGTGVKLYPLPSGDYKLPSCSSADSQEEHPREVEGADGLVEQLPLAELEIEEEPTEEDKPDVAPCPEGSRESCPVCLDATEDADLVSQYCKSDYAAVVSIADDVFSSTPY
ncbi:unnamed protein product, partial [Ixodes hexagonus]